MYFHEIKRDEHYSVNHEKDFPWSEVVKLILMTKHPRKKGNKIEIKTQDYYILCEIRNKVLYVINAKRTK